MTNGYEDKCDAGLKTGWYRFKVNGADAVMPTSCVQVRTYSKKESLVLGGLMSDPKKHNQSLYRERR